MRHRSGDRAVQLVVFLAAAVFFLEPARAIVTRHDRDDAAYRALGERHREAVSILPDGAGVLIGSRWVLTAAHVARGVAGRDPRVELAGREIAVSRIFVHPRWKDMGPHDVAVLELAEAIQDVTPASLYAGRDEVGQVVTFLGRGDHGTGLTGPETRDRVKRGATNRVDEADADWLYFTFEQGSEATELEGVSGPGDSGGPALLDVDGTTYTLGVSVFSDGRGKGPGRYGVREGYTRVSTHRRWIEQVLAGELDDQGITPGSAVQQRRHARTRTGSPGQGGAELPGTPAGKLVADYIEVYNGNDDERMRRYIADRFSPSLRERRTEAEHLALYRHLYDDLFGRLAVVEVREVTDGSITVLFRGAQGSMAEIRFELKAGDRPMIDGMSVAQVNVSMR